LYEDQITAKERKFIRQKKKGNKILKKRKHPVFPSENGWVTLLPSVQKTLSEIENPYITGVEGFSSWKAALMMIHGRSLTCIRNETRQKNFSEQ